MLLELTKYRKAVTAVVGAVLVLLAAFAPGKYDAQVAQVLSFLTAVGVYVAPNASETKVKAEKVKRAVNKAVK